MKRVLIFLVTLALVFSCETKHQKFDPDKWYQQTKDFILTESNLSTDSTFTENYEDGKQHKVKAFSKGQLTIEKMYRETGEQVAETHYSRDGQFELRREICQDGQVSFEGIFYRQNAYGRSTWWNCKKEKTEEGLRFRDRKVGIWRSWNDKNEMTETDYKNYDLTDSLQTIKSYDSSK